MAAIRVKHSAGSYEIRCERGLLRRAEHLTAALGDVTGVYLLSSPRVWKHLGRDLQKAFPAVKRLGVILFDDRESRKDLASLELICRALLKSGADRRAVLVAVGGGVVGDVAGFAAASYLRGVRLVHIPTTLVAQVDSSIGGKTGVNLPEGKNLVGAFYPPRMVLVDPETLRTLPHREFRSGLYEVVKYGIIGDAQLFAFLEGHMFSCLRRDPQILSRVIDRCIRAKARVVSRDERESGLRETLNFGHTLGHALETATGYRRFLHGEAIGWGMIAATLLSVTRNRMPESAAARILRLIANIGPLPPLTGIRAADLRRIMAGDKKARGGQVRWVLAPKIGSAQWGAEIPWPVVAETFAALPAILARAQRS